MGVGEGGTVTAAAPNATGRQNAALGYPPDLAPVPVIEQESYDIYMPYLFSGTADGTGFCTVNVKSQLGCPNPQPFTNFLVARNISSTTTPPPAIRPALDPGQVVPLLSAANLLQLTT